MNFFEKKIVICFIGNTQSFVEDRCKKKESLFLDYCKSNNIDHYDGIIALAMEGSLISTANNIIKIYGTESSEPDFLLENLQSMNLTKPQVTLNHPAFRVL